MNILQSAINRNTEQLLKNEEWCFGQRITSFYKMRKVFKTEICEGKFEWLFEKRSKAVRNDRG